MDPKTNVGEGGLHFPNDLLDVPRQGSSVGVTQTEKIGATFDRSLERRAGIARVGFVPVKEVLGIVDELGSWRCLSTCFQIGGTVTDDTEVLIERRAQDVQHVKCPTLPHQCNDRRLSIDHGLNVGILVGPAANAASAAEGRDARVVQLEIAHSLEVGDVLGVGARPPAFDVVDAQLVQQLGDLDLVLNGQGDALCLRAVAQCCIVEPYVVRLSA